MAKNQLLTDAINELQHLNPAEEFLVKDLFKGYVWNRIDKSARLRLGILFLNEITSNPTSGVEVLSKTSANQQKYRKK
jgi:hypothetical protein